MLAKPAPDEHADYYGLYISQVPEGDIIERLATQIEETDTLLRHLPEEVQTYRYAPGKWSLREVVGHLADVERVFAVRALAFARKDPAHRPSFEQDDYAAASNAHRRPMGDLLDEYRAVRAATVALFRGLEDEAWGRRGIASGYEFSVRALPWIIAGHELHHRRIIGERYPAVRSA